MDGGFNTMQEFMTYTKGMLYIFMGLFLVGVIGFWKFLTARDDEDQPGHGPGGGH